MNGALQRAGHGALAGAVGAACMTALRMGAHRAGLIQKQVPQVVEEWMVHRSGRAPRGGPAGHQAASQLVHLGYGAAWAAAFALGQRGGRSRAPLLRGALFGAAQWAFGFFVLMPALGVTRPAWRQRPRELGVNLSAHLLYGAVTALVSEEMQQQRQRTPRSELARRLATVG
ncbi:hypothetical protein FGE12_26360 [Aggregicoccus sp. 17bor-14]|uniref:DUF6789 family protein n=1 Tax=Myxococcaceae TaxID=31 RepID=UPI00129CC6B5|nr:MULTISPECIES: DUF6789 family protein [Myxococcaceae]MBF5045963.1 hypothetical protein [Simulacricoccus sp. 17bor-14]MRI91695.1 hypothetical protein [Aggregicoccus sp. 17bor-14]